ncbi:PAS domain S-box protein [Pelotomaculum propionicicum]|uniref:PAS domain S-box protein n=1 Tax=Pelotomaculum propionicicum TaxID=258475 RepID=UPI003B79338D
MFSFIRELFRDIARRKQVKEALRESEERYQAIFDTTGTAILIVEEDNTISLVNSEFEKLSGYSKLETEGKKKWSDFITKDYLKIVKEYHRLRNIDPDSAPKNYEIQFINRQGKTRDITLTVKTLPGTKQYLVSCLDITKSKRAARALRNQSLFLQRLIDNIPNPVFHKDVNGIYQGCNKACEEFLGRTKGEIVGKSVYEIYPKDLADKYYEMDSALFREPGVQIYEYSFLYADGTRRDVIFNKATYTNTDGTLAGLVCAAVDISERKKTEEEIRQSEALLRSIVESPRNIMTFSLDINYRYIFFNKAHHDTMKNIWGADIELGKSMLEYITCPKDRDRAAVNFDRALCGEQFSVIEEYSGENLDRSYWENIFSPIVIETGKTIGVTVFCSDISEHILAERKLRAANQQHLDIIDFLPDATFAIDRDGRVIAWNRAIEEMTGVCKEDMLGRGDYAYSVPFYGNQRPILIDLIFLENSSFESRYEYTERKENTIYAEALTPCVYNGKGAIMWGKASPLFDSDGNLIGAIESIRDITERKKAEDQLRGVNQQLEDIIEFLPDATLVVNKDRKVIAWNKAIEEMTGVKKEEMIGRGDYAYAVPFYGEPRPILIDLVLMPQKEVEDKYDYIIRSGGTLITETDVPFTYKGKGANLWGIATLLLDSDGNVIGAIESIRDVTDHKNTVEALRLSEQRFSKIFNASPSMMCISTVEEGRFIEANHRFLQVSGYSREELIGLTASDISFWVKPERADVIKSLRKNGMVNNLECVFREKSGEVYIGLYSAEIVNFNGEEFVLSVVNDISERKRLEEEMSRLERLNLVGEMAAGIGHEIRNPMTTVRGFLQMLGEKQECSNFREYYNLMIDELDRANSIITEYLSLAKNKAVSKQYQNLNHILKALFPLIQADAMRTDMYVHIGLEDIPDLLLDEKEIRQLILNMFRNGLEAMSPGKKITIRTFVEDNEVVLAIQDQGKGIEQDDLEKLGTPFFTTKDHGTGLGLAVCYSIAARHNAAIRVETGSAGTTFYVCFAISQPNH